MVARETKRCNKCSEIKPHAEFSRCKNTKDGLQGTCKPCDQKSTAAWIAQNPKRKAEADKRWALKNKARKAENRRRWGEENPERLKENMQRHKERNPEKARARWQIRAAVSAGRIEKPARCEDCNREFEPKALHGHHEDYSKTLEVEWLCHGCHTKRHNSADE